MPTAQLSSESSSPPESGPEPELPGTIDLSRVSLSEVGNAGGPYVWKKPDAPGRPKRDGNCSPEQLQYYQSGGTGVFNSPEESD